MTARTPALKIVEAGWSTTIQDHGRRSYADLGVPTAGAVDRRAHDLVNRLVGNRPDAATLETNRGLLIEANCALIVAISANGSRLTLQPGERLRIEAPDSGMWGYLAVRGGIDVDPVLGSRSHDTLSGLGPEPLVDGSTLAVGRDPQSPLPTDLAPQALVEHVVRLWPGPRAEWFHGGIEALTSSRWTVQADVSRVGIRLSRGVFERTESAMSGTMPSEGLVEGAIQVTPAGEPIVMLANHPTTGGYPVVAVVDPDDIGIVAQMRPETLLRFRSA